MKKNILILFCDQFRADMISALGNSLIKTPAIDSLVSRGISFTSAYTPCPVCVAARYTFHTGISPYESGCTDNMTMPYNKSFMEILSEHGYQTHGVGKMHFTFEGKSTNDLWGFNSRDISEECGYNDDYKKYIYENGYEHVKDPQGVRSEMYYIPQPSQLPERLHNNTWVVNKSIEFLQKRDKERPFMLMTSFIKPHPPFETPTPWNKLFRGPEMPDAHVPDNWEDLICHVNRSQNCYKYRSQGIDRNLIRQIRAAYYNCVSFIDYNIGKLLEYMRSENIFEDTLIIFTADHGEMLGDYNSFGKRCFLEPSANIPMIVANINQSNICSNTPVSLYDIMPTLLDYADIKLDENREYEGKNLTTLLTTDDDRTVYGQFGSNDYGLYMARNKKYKYIYSAPDNKEWLFDMVNDPHETKNLCNILESVKDTMKTNLINNFKSKGITSPFQGNDFIKYPTKTVDAYNDNFLIYQDPDDSIPHIKGYERN